MNTITFRLRDGGPDLLPEYLHGTVEIVAAAADTPAVPVPGQWNGLPVTPSKLTYQRRVVPGWAMVIPETTSMDVSRNLPATSDMWHTYARGTHMNMVQMGTHRYWYQPGVYLFKLSPEIRYPATEGRRLQDHGNRLGHGGQPQLDVTDHQRSQPQDLAPRLNRVKRWLLRLAPG